MPYSDETPRRSLPPLPNWALPAAVVVLLFTTVVCFGYLLHERHQSQDLASANKTLTASLGQVQQQLDSMTARLNTLGNKPETITATPVTLPVAPQPQEQPLPKPRPMTRQQHAARVHRASAEDSRWRKMQDQLSDQEKAIASTREQVEKNRQDLQGQLTSTHDELSGSIARTHDELVALEKRGERNYIEFQIDKSKQFQRVGPIGLSLRKADTKHRRYDLMMMVEDQQLQKKSVNLYEPVWISVSDRPAPVELVVNEIHKNLIKGYVSEPKYRKSELASTGAADRTKLQPATAQQQ